MFSKYTKQILRLFKKMIDKIHNLLHINIHAHYFKSHISKYVEIPGNHH